MGQELEENHAGALEEELQGLRAGQGRAGREGPGPWNIRHGFRGARR